MVSVTSARPSGGREAVPAKTTSSILPPRSDLAPCSPMTQARASTTLDLPEPLGPTTQVMPRSNLSVVAEANDLKPRNVRVFRYTCRLSSRFPHPTPPRRVKQGTAACPRAPPRAEPAPPKGGSQGGTGGAGSPPVKWGAPGGLAPPGQHSKEQGR